MSEAKRDAVKRVLEAATLEEVLPTTANSMKVAFRILSLQAGKNFYIKGTVFKIFNSATDPDPRISTSGTNPDPACAIFVNDLQSIFPYYF